MPGYRILINEQSPPPRPPSPPLRPPSPPLSPPARYLGNPIIDRRESENQVIKLLAPDKRVTNLSRMSRRKYGLEKSGPVFLPPKNTYIYHITTARGKTKRKRRKTKTAVRSYKQRQFPPRKTKGKKTKRR